MKKLICALVLLAMLVPVAAMAANLPTSLDKVTDRSRLTFDGRAGSMGSTGYRYVAEEYTGLYSMTGDLFRYSRRHECGCIVSYGPDGTILANDIRHAVQGGPPYVWNNVKGKWFDDETGKEVEASKKPHDFKHEDHPGNVNQAGGELSSPPRNLLDVLKGYESFAALKQDLTSGVGLTSGDYSYSNNQIEFTNTQWDEVFVNGKYMSHDDGFSGDVPSSNTLRIMVKKDDKSALYENGVLKQVYIGSVVYDVDQQVFRIYNDAKYGTRIFANYRMSDGGLIEYGITSTDGTLKTVYNANNILQTHEYWSSETGYYWNYYNGKWTYSTTGEYEDNMPAGTPPIDVLEAVVRAPSPVTYDFGLTSSANNLPKDQPSIIGNAAAIGGSTPQVTADALSSHTTKYELELVGSTDELNEGVYVALPLNAGITKSLLETELDLTIEHNGDVYSTMDNSITLKDGLAVIYTESFSPFNMTWGEEGTLKSGKSPTPTFSLEGFGSTSGIENLPSTGDSSNLLAYACLLLVSAAALYMLGKRRAHQ